MFCTAACGRDCRQCAISDKLTRSHAHCPAGIPARIALRAHVFGYGEIGVEQRCADIVVTPAAPGQLTGNRYDRSRAIAAAVFGVAGLDRLDAPRGGVVNGQCAISWPATPAGDRILRGVRSGSGASVVRAMRLRDRQWRFRHAWLHEMSLLRPSRSPGSNLLGIRPVRRSRDAPYVRDVGRTVIALRKCLQALRDRFDVRSWLRLVKQIEALEPADRGFQYTIWRHRQPCRPLGGILSSPRAPATWGSGRAKKGEEKATSSARLGIVADFDDCNRIATKAKNPLTS